MSRSAVFGFLVSWFVTGCAESPRLVDAPLKGGLLSAEAGTSGVLGTFTLIPPPNHVDGMAATSTGITLPSGVPVHVTVSGKMDFTPNPAWLTCFGPNYPPLSLTSVGPSGFPPAGDFSVQVGEGSATSIQPGAFVSLGPRDFASDTAGVDLLGGGGELWVRRSGVSETCGNTPAYLVSGSQVVVVRSLQKTLHVTVAVSPQDIAPPVNPRCRGIPGKARVSVNASWSDGSSAQGLAVSLRTQFEGGSGGHAHQADDRDGFGQLGQSSGQLDASGAFMTDYLAGEVGGTERVIAVVSGDGQTATATSEVQIRVPGLAELGEGPTFLLVGGIDPHPSNHFATGFTIGNLSILADSFFAANQKKLEYNDISLQGGGLFDLDANFTAALGHEGHRCGQETDIRTRTLVDPDELDDVRNLVTVWLHGDVYDETLTAQPHYHITFVR